ncbi:hypothetical protein DWX17_22645 [[Clostridium] innocuum]|jgi:hypothetical protein|uniref:hypothetical protein n=2 Tax=Clostridium innocuum TaxID=1522 RepID=UPI000E4D6EE1|nr:hypothetical protein [[Clostridium] innocuum]RGT60314.1 hypothetical protein DWX17_22645 [[Clostridium] innocuum]
MKPILFNTEMVQAILEGRKTVTRRIIKGLPQDVKCIGWLTDSGNAKSYGTVAFDVNGNRKYFKLPYLIGDILYVRETFVTHRNDVFYKADNEWLKLKNLGISFKWKPSIHMPKEAARLFLRITDVRIERLQDITEEQAMQEGIEKMSTPNISGVGETFIQGFGELWNSTIKKSELDKYGWHANPYVFVYRFNVISKAEAMKESEEE